jgi:hypothetical protein
MKRSLLLSLFAVAIVAMTFGQAMAAITVQLNLRYNNPADGTSGGTWDLLAKTDSAFGIAGVTAVVNNINLAGITLNTGIGAIPLESKITGSIVEFVYGQDLNGAAGVGKILNVGRGAGTPGNVADDDLFPGANAAYDNMAKLASGTFGATRPSLDTTVATGFAGNEWTNAAMTTVTAASPVFTYGGGDGVRGDSVAVDGLKPGDTNRDGTVNVTDLGNLATNWQLSPRGWDQGNFNGPADTLVNVTDLGALATNWQQTSASPALAAVPEPTSIFLAGICGLLGFVRRSR